MSHRALRMIRLAVTVPQFRSDLLNGGRSTILARFGLDDEEYRALIDTVRCYDWVHRQLDRCRSRLVQHLQIE